MGFFDFLKPKRVQEYISGGDGGSVETAVVIAATTAPEGILAQYAYITREHGEEDVGWRRDKSKANFSIRSPKSGGRTIRTIPIILSSGESKTYFFDITDWCGKF